MTKIYVVGAGMGGLSASIRLARAGHQVSVFEASNQLGGKAGMQSIDNVSFDTGPSVLTLPEVIEDLIEFAGYKFNDLIQLRELNPSFRYIFEDDVTLDIYQNIDDTLESIANTLGSEAKKDLSIFLSYAQKIWEASKSTFVFSRSPDLRTILKLGPKRWLQLADADPTTNMYTAIQRKVRSPHLCAILARYATYNGSDPRVAPATLNCIAHVELNLGGWGIEGGLQHLVNILARIAQELGVKFYTNTKVIGIDVQTKNKSSSGYIRGLELQNGQYIECNNIIVNADVSHLYQDLLPNKFQRKKDTTDRSMSGYTAVLQAAPNPKRAPHTLLMSTPYLNEFRDIFDNDRPPINPTIYLCDQYLTHNNGGWENAVPLFMMANAPAEPELHSRNPAIWKELLDSLLQKSIKSKILDIDDKVVWTRTPTDLAKQFPGSLGSIYGDSSNNMLAAFRRAANQSSPYQGSLLSFRICSSRWRCSSRYFIR